MLLVHYSKDVESNSYCGLTRRDIIQGHQTIICTFVYKDDYTIDRMCPECSKHPNVQLQLLATAEL